MTLSPSQIAALREIAERLPGRATVIIGATALGFHVDMRWRQTADVDLALAIDAQELNQIATWPGWTQHAAGHTNSDHRRAPRWTSCPRPTRSSNKDRSHGETARS